MPVFQVRERSCTPEGRLYLLVDFWLGDTAVGEPDLTNDFILDIPRFEYPIVRDGSGNVQLTDGTWVTPAVARTMDASLFARTEVAVDVRQRVRRYIRQYLQRAMAQRIRGDHTADHTKPMFINGRRIRKRPVSDVVRDSVDRRQQFSSVDLEGTE